MNKHTPTPWVLSNNGFQIYSGDGVAVLVAEIADHMDAAHIVTCVNAWSSPDALRMRLCELEGR